MLVLTMYKQLGLGGGVFVKKKHFKPPTSPLDNFLVYNFCPPPLLPTPPINFIHGSKE